MPKQIKVRSDTYNRMMTVNVVKMSPHYKNLDWKIAMVQIPSNKNVGIAIKKGKAPYTMMKF